MKKISNSQIFLGLACSLAVISIVACSNNNGSGSSAKPVVAAGTNLPNRPLPGQPGGLQLNNMRGSSNKASQGIPEDDYYDDATGTWKPSSQNADGSNSVGATVVTENQKIQSNKGTTAPKLANDNIMDLLTTKIEARAKDHSAADLKLAKAVRSVETKIDGKSRELSVEISENDNFIIDGPMIDRKAVLKNNVDQKKLSGKAVCLDADVNSCKTVSLEVMDSDKKAEIRALVRHTNAMLKVKEDRGPDSPSADYVQMKNIFLTTEDQNKALSKTYIRTILFESSEVVHGATFVRISMITNDNQVIGLSGSLKLPVEGATFTEGTLTKNYGLASLSGIFPNNNYGTDLQALIQGAQILRVNNGKDFNLLINVAGNQPDNQQTISLTLTRDYEPTVELK